MAYSACCWLPNLWMSRTSLKTCTSLTKMQWLSKNCKKRSWENTILVKWLPNKKISQISVTRTWRGGKKKKKSWLNKLKLLRMEELLKLRSHRTGSTKNRRSLFIWFLILMKILAGARVPMNISPEPMLTHNMPVSDLFWQQSPNLLLRMNLWNSPTSRWAFSSLGMMNKLKKRKNKWRK